jgi:hypothetical protein
MSGIVIPDYPIIRTLALGTLAHYSQSMSGWRKVPSRRGVGYRYTPELDGGSPRPVRLGVIRFLHEVIVDGHYDPDGTLREDPHEGLDLNLELLDEACAPATSSPWTFTATHVRPHGSREAQIQVLDMTEPAKIGTAVVSVTLDIQIPSGTYDDVDESS